MQPEEIPLDEAMLADIRQMYYGMSVIKLARDTFLSLTLCGPFSFSIPALGLYSNGGMEMIISRFWMPWERKTYDWTEMIGICPYYMEMQGEHSVPVVPDMNLGTITTLVGKDHKVRYKWYWNHGFEQYEEKKMYWIVTDHSPLSDGTIRSPLASIIGQYRTLMILQRSLEITATQRARPTHVLEYHPSPMGSKNDELTQLVANFGERAAGMSKARQEMARANEIRVRTAELLKQTRQVAAQNTARGLANRKRLLWTDNDVDDVELIDSGLSTRMVPLRPDYKYVSAMKAEVVAEYEKHLQMFNTMAAAVMGFALELIQPTGSTRATNVKGNERFENERIKAGLSFFTDITKTALIIAYRKQFEQGFEQAARWKIRGNGGNASEVAHMYPEMDVQVDMSCTPMMTYDEMKQFWLDGIMTKEKFALHAFHMHSMPMDHINVTSYPDQVPKDMLPLATPSTNKKKK